MPLVTMPVIAIGRSTRKAIILEIWPNHIRNLYLYSGFGACIAPSPPDGVKNNANQRFFGNTPFDKGCDGAICDLHTKKNLHSRCPPKQALHRRRGRCLPCRPFARRSFCGDSRSFCPHSLAKTRTALCRRPCLAAAWLHRTGTGTGTRACSPFPCVKHTLISRTHATTFPIIIRWLLIEIAYSIGNVV